MVRFPSVEFFEALRGLVNADQDRFRRLGTVDMTLVASIGYPGHIERYAIEFAGYRCTGVRKLALNEPAPKDAIILEGAYPAWREMVEDIVRNGGADLEHTLNTLTLLDDPMRVVADNQLDVDLFYRYQQNLQDFFDAAAHVPISFAEEEQALPVH
jgi:hypothetical protein